MADRCAFAALHRLVSSPQGQVAVYTCYAFAIARCVLPGRYFRRVPVCTLWGQQVPWSNGADPVKNRLMRLRAISNKAQGGRCFYCGVAMWSGDPSTFQADFGLKGRRIAAFQCTAEHLQARCDGGLDKEGNVVAACRLCNVRRHRGPGPALPPLDYLRRVRGQIQKGKWHHPWAFDLGLVSRGDTEAFNEILGTAPVTRFGTRP